uniref:RP9 pre-mRNA splicing factor n=1 Tax=Neolamprologus brichardi TaxID=32507 RepID=A0A3Q4MKU2_NEOBR
MSDRKRAREKEDRRHHKREKIPKDDLEKLKKHTKKVSQEVQKLKHIETFYEKPPPGFIKEHEEKPEDCIPAEPGNEEARSFLAHAPTKGLWMPLGREVKVMQCWRCKRYGHRTGDRECPFFITGNQKLEHFRVTAPPLLHPPPLITIAERRGKRRRTKRRKTKRRARGSESTSPKLMTPPIQTEGMLIRELEYYVFCT